jgi:hypothetical protein
MKPKRKAKVDRFRSPNEWISTTVEDKSGSALKKEA